MEDHERMFARRAFDMLHDVDHIDRTDAILRIPNAVEFPGARWPGYLGSTFRVGSGVLAIANVHRELRSGRLKTDPRGEVAQTVEATRRLQSVTRSQLTVLDLAEYIQQHRAAYRAGLAGGWTVGHAFRKAFEACGIEFTPRGIDRVAYVNASCCQVPEDKRFEEAGVDSRKVKKELREVCRDRHPIPDLVSWLKPAVVLTTSADAYDRLTSRPTLGPVATLYFHQQLGSHPLLRDAMLDGRLFRAAESPHIDAWAPALARHLAAHDRGP